MRYLEKISLPVYLAAGLSIVAAQIHAYLLAEHFSMWWGYGAAFLVMVLFQDVFSVLLVTHRRPSVYYLGMAVSAVMVGLWLLCHTFGIPLGPSAGEVEPVGVLDVATQMSEIGLIVLLAALARPQVRVHLPHRAVA